MPVDSTDSAPDITLELGSSNVDHIPEVDLVSQFGEGSQKCLDGGVGTDSSDVLKLTVNL